MKKHNNDIHSRTDHLRDLGVQIQHWNKYTYL